ncbi:unnamed protein product [Scytosiphon promiscuus]
MGIGEEEFLIPPALSHMASSGSDSRDRRRHQHQHQQPGRRKLLQPLCIAVGIFGVSTGAARFLFPRKKLEPLQRTMEVDQSFAVRTDDGYTTSECATPQKVVMKGADLTKYYAMGHGEPAVFGFEDYETVHNGYRYWFQSEENKAKFEANPNTYIPAWGGFCSWGISREDFWSKDTLGPDADPNQWLITSDGKLHFFRSELPMRKFLGDVEGNIVAGNALWYEWWGGAEPSSTFLTSGSPLDTDCFCSPDTCEDN